MHEALDNKTLAAIGEDPETLRLDPAIARFLDWIANKPPDFHAPTHGKARR